MLFLGLENEGMIFREAQRLGILKEKKSKDPKRQEEKNKLRKEQEAYLHPRIVNAEKRFPYQVSFHAHKSVKGCQAYSV